MMHWVAFAVFFGAGPVLFRVLTRPVPTGRQQVLLGILAAAAILTGLALRYEAFLPSGGSVFGAIAALGLFWLAWVAVLALGAQSLGRQGASRVRRRWANVAGSAGTTVPWFGLAFATWITG